MDIKTEKEIDPLEVPKPMNEEPGYENNVQIRESCTLQINHEPVQIKIEPREEGEIKFGEETAILGSSVVRVEFENVELKQESCSEENEMTLVEFCHVDIKSESTEFENVEIKSEPVEFENVEIKSEPVEFENVEIEPQHVEFENVVVKSEPLEFENVNIKSETVEFENVEMQVDDFDEEGELVIDEHANLDLDSQIDIKEDPLNSPEISSNKKEEEILEIKKVSCNICQQIIAGSTALIEHKKTLHPGQGNTCDFCNKYFKNRKLVYGHITSVHSDKKFPCSQCKYVANSKKYLLFHIRYHHKPENESHKCDFCDKTFRLFSAVREHYVRSHSNRAQPVATCTICNLDYKDASGLRRHNRRKHAKVKK